MSTTTAIPHWDQLVQLGDPHPDVRGRAYAALAAAYGPSAQRQFYELLAHEDLVVRQRAALALDAIDQWAAHNPGAPALRGGYVACLGPLGVFAGQQAVDLRAAALQTSGRAGWLKVQGVFAFLVHCGRAGATRATIGAAVWGQRVVSTTTGRTLVALRQVLESAGTPWSDDETLAISPGLTTLAPDRYLCDAQLFERVFQVALDTEEQQGAEAALPFFQLASLRYTGPYMDGVPHSGEIYAERRSRLLNEYLIALDHLAEHAFRQQHYRQCLRVCQRGLDADPAAEELNGWVLRTYHTLGLRGEVERTYRNYLRAAALDPAAAEATDDPVVRLYQSLQQARALGE